MPVGINKVHPLLGAVASCGAVEEGIGTGECLVKKTDEVVLHSSLKLGVVTELAVHSFELVS